MNSGLQRISARAITALVAAILVLIIEVPPRVAVRVRLGTTEATASWMLAVIALTFGQSSIFKRESLWPLALVASFISIIELAYVLELVSTYYAPE